MIVYKNGKSLEIPRNLGAYARTEDYWEGFNEGYASGCTDCHETGYQEGYESGYTVGLAESFPAGYDSGYTDGYTSGRTDGVESGYTSGYTTGYDSGYTNGYTSGYTSGNTAGIESGYTSGYTTGYAAKTAEIAEQTSGLTATASDIISGKTAMIAGGNVVTGSFLADFSRYNFRNTDMTTMIPDYFDLSGLQPYHLFDQCTGTTEVIQNVLDRIDWEGKNDLSYMFSAARITGETLDVNTHDKIISYMFNQSNNFNFKFKNLDFSYYTRANQAISLFNSQTPNENFEILSFSNIGFGCTYNSYINNPFWVLLNSAIHREAHLPRIVHGLVDYSGGTQHELCIPQAAYDLLVADTALSAEVQAKNWNLHA